MSKKTPAIFFNSSENENEEDIMEEDVENTVAEVTLENISESLLDVGSQVSDSSIIVSGQNSQVDMQISQLAETQNVIVDSNLRTEVSIQEVVVEKRAKRSKKNPKK